MDYIFAIAFITVVPVSMLAAIAIVEWRRVILAIIAAISNWLLVAFAYYDMAMACQIP